MTSNKHINIIENKDLEKIRLFIEDNFIDSKDISINIVNLKKLITFLNKNNIKLNYYDLSSLLEYSYKLENTIKVIKQRKIISNIFENMDSEVKRIYKYSINIIDKNNSKSDKKSNKIYKEFNEYQRNTRHKERLTYEKQNELLLRISNGDKEAKNELIMSYLPLALGIAGKYKYAWNYEDLVQIGTIGLIDAIENYDPKKGKNFSRYISAYIEGTICNNLYSDIRLSPIVYIKMKLMIKIMLENYFKYDKVLSEEELSKISNLKIETIEKYKKIFKLLEKDSSFNRLNLNDELVDYIEEDKLIDQEYYNELNKLFDSVSLTSKEQKVIKLIYFENIENEAEVARILGITRERVRQLKLKALRKLRYDLEIRKYTGLNNRFIEDYNQSNKFKKARTKLTYNK